MCHFENCCLCEDVWQKCPLRAGEFTDSNTYTGKCTKGHSPLSKKQAIKNDLYPPPWFCLRRNVLRQVARERNLFVEGGSELEVPIRKLLSPSARLHLDEYERKFLAGGNDLFHGFVSDLNQNPSARDMSRCILPAMPTRTLRYSHSKQRLVTWGELFTAHGWPAIPQFANNREMLFDLKQIPASALSRLLGNSMHLTALSSFIFWGLSHAERLQAPKGYMESGHAGDDAALATSLPLPPEVSESEALTPPQQWQWSV